MGTEILAQACATTPRRRPASHQKTNWNWRRRATEAPFRHYWRTHGKQSARTTNVVTQINVFIAPEGGQQALIDFLKEAAQFASSTPGWLSASVHCSRDGTRVVNYAQSENLEAAHCIIERLREDGWLERNKAFGNAHRFVRRRVYAGKIG